MFQIKLNKPFPKLILGNSLEKLKSFPSNHVDCIIQDPPYGVNIFGKSWDTYINMEEFQSWNFKWGVEAFRVLKPGGYLATFGSNRTIHRIVCGLEEAKFINRDMLFWLHSESMPKSYDVGQALQKYLSTGKSRRKDRNLNSSQHRYEYSGKRDGKTGIANTGGKIELTYELAKKYEGYGTAVKNCYEPIALLRKPLELSNVAKNIIKYKTGALNIKACGAKDGRWAPNILYENNILDDKISRFYYHCKVNKVERNIGLKSGEFNNHPCLKPISVLRYIVRLITPENGLVLDMFSGTASTALACILENKRFIGFELDEDYYLTGLKRINYVINNKKRMLEIT